MRISRIKIENYRSIKQIEMELSGIVSLVGPNNAGKTNILSALNFLLGDRWPTRNALEPTDWFAKDDQRDIRIQAWFAPNERNVKSIWFYFPAHGNAETKMEFSNGSTYNLSSEIREECALVYLDATRSFERHFGTSQWSIFGKVIRQLGEDFKQSSPVFKQQEVMQHFSTAQELLKTELYKRFEARIASAFREQTKLTLHNVRLDFKTFDPLNFYKSLHPILVEEGIAKNPIEAGQGMRNLILLALFRAYATIFKGDAIIAIEEPELYLHPHAQRSLASLFVELADRGNQILFSTHSGVFIDPAQVDRIVLVDQREDDRGDRCTQIIPFLYRFKYYLFSSNPVCFPQSRKAKVVSSERGNALGC